MNSPHIVCDPCHDCKYTDCVFVCPVDCFYEDENQLYIDPVECIGCEACVAECPVEAIFADGEVPDKWHDAIQLNIDRSAELKVAGKNITEKQEPKLGPGCSKG